MRRISPTQRFERPAALLRVVAAKRFENTGMHHQYEPGPVAKLTRRIFAACTPVSVKKHIAGNVLQGLVQVERLEKETSWLRANGTPLEVLGLPAHADLHDVKLRYKDLLFETHPDTAAAAARKAGLDPLLYTAGAAGHLAIPSEDALRDEQLRRFELLQQAYKIATDPTSAWHVNGSSPVIYRELAKPSLLQTVVRPLTFFGSIGLTLFAVVATFIVFIAIPAVQDEFFRVVNPKLHKFIADQESEEARLRAEGIRPDTNPLRYAPVQVKLLQAPGSTLRNPEDDVHQRQWNRPAPSTLRP